MAFSWSFSRLGRYENCPLSHKELDILKNFPDTNDYNKWGNEVHAALAVSCATGAPLPDTMNEYKKWVNSIRKWAKCGGTILVENKFALTRDFQPTQWFGPKEGPMAVWYRGIADLVVIAGAQALVLDWKTGKPKSDSKQLMLMAACVFAFFPEVREIDSGYVWLKTGALTTEHYTRESVTQEWVGLLPRVTAMETASTTNSYPPKPGKLCGKWCPVLTCSFNGRYVKPGVPQPFPTMSLTRP